MVLRTIPMHDMITAPPLPFADALFSLQHCCLRCSIPPLLRSDSMHMCRDVSAWSE